MRWKAHVPSIVSHPLVVSLVRRQGRHPLRMPCPWESPWFRDEPSTPQIHVSATLSRSSWDDDDLKGRKKYQAGRRERRMQANWSERGERASSWTERS